MATNPAAGAQPAGAQPAGAQPGVPVDPYPGFRFRLTGPGIEGQFTAVTGMGVLIHPIRYSEGGAKGLVRALPGLVEYTDITLWYGLTASQAMMQWAMSAAEGKPDFRKNLSVILLKENGTDEAMRWDLIRAWVREWRAAHLDALGNEIAVEKLTIVCESIQRA
jgi:phage tail-like protein